ncbi:PA14 domain-containing protein [Candidatus Amarolinea dominans]|uniref:PA14 domain-containing protein n=1 Tax=Candidatus Amarolinea dominans TaxID=3140696 RepID=UPI0031371B0E|nr:hypothetical protein [Anaerolineae bacterium]
MLVRNDSSVDFNGAAPRAWSARGQLQRAVGRAPCASTPATIALARSDDGVRIWLDNWLVTDQWYDGGAGLRSDFQGVGAGEHTVRIEYYEAQAARSPPLVERTTPSRSGRANTSNNTNLDDVPVLVRNDSAINFNWGSDAPAAQIARDLLLGPLDAS